MDHSLLSAGRTTHLKIVAVALVFAIVVVLVGVNARTSDIATAHSQTKGAVVKAGQPATYADNEAQAVR
jgi:hypothetical protein